MATVNVILKYPYNRDYYAWEIFYAEPAEELYNTTCSIFYKLSVTDENAKLLAKLVKILP